MTDGHVPLLTRAGIWPLARAGGGVGAFRVPAPGLAYTDYAWSIKPSVNAIFIVGLSVAGHAVTGLDSGEGDALADVLTLPPALWVLATSLLAATIIHGDRFKWDYPLTWVWDGSVRRGRAVRRAVPGHAPAPGRRGAASG